MWLSIVLFVLLIIAIIRIGILNQENENLSKEYLRMKDIEDKYINEKDLRTSYYSQLQQKNLELSHYINSLNALAISVNAFNGGRGLKTLVLNSIKRIQGIENNKKRINK